MRYYLTIEGPHENTLDRLRALGATEPKWYSALEILVFVFEGPAESLLEVFPGCIALPPTRWENPTPGNRRSPRTGILR